MPEKDQESETVRFPYRREKAILSAAELALFKALVAELDSQYVICPKVRLGDIFTAPRKKSEQFYRYRINQKHVDFLLCDASTMAPKLGIELDDSSHDRLDRQERDHFVDQVYAAAGLPMLHIRATATYDPSAVAWLIRDSVGKKFDPSTATVRRSDVPNCPKCGVRMLLKTANKGARNGDAFWGCRNFPQCEELKSF